MILLALGCSYRTAPVEIRERLAFNEERLTRALDELNSRLGYEAVILSTCNRVELYVGSNAAFPEGPDTTESHLLGFLANFHGLEIDSLSSYLYVYRNKEAVRHLFRVAASLDSLVIGEGQIAGQVKKAYELALTQSCTGPLLNALFPHARRVARRVRTETGISQGHVSVSSAAVDYVQEVFDHFSDKVILVIGAGKMGELTLRHLRELHPQQIWVTNRSPDKALALASACAGQAIPWEKLDEALARAEIVLSTTGAPEVIVDRERWNRILPRRAGRTAVILDIAVPRDFDPAIHDGETTFLFNIDDLQKTRELTLARRREHVAPAEAITDQESQRFLKDWARRRNGPVIERLTREFEGKRQEVVRKLFSRLNGRLTDSDRQYIDKAFSLLQNQILHGPISALAEEAHEASSAASSGGHSLLDAFRKLFRIQD